MTNANKAGDVWENPVNEQDDVLDMDAMTNDERALIRYFDCKFISFY